MGSRKKKRSKGVSRRGSITLAPWAIRRFLSVGKPARGRLSAMCRPYSCSNGEGWNSGTSTRCSSCPGAICSQAAGAALFRGRPIGVQPRTSWKKAVDRASSRVARVLPRQERSSQTGNHGTTPPYGRELAPGRTGKREVDSDSLFRVFRWIPWLILIPGSRDRLLLDRIDCKDLCGSWLPW